MTFSKSSPSVILCLIVFLGGTSCTVKREPPARQHGNTRSAEGRTVPKKRRKKYRSCKTAPKRYLDKQTFLSTKRVYSMLDLKRKWLMKEPRGKLNWTQVKYLRNYQRIMKRRHTALGQCPYAQLSPNVRKKLQRLKDQARSVLNIILVIIRTQEKFIEGARRKRMKAMNRRLKRKKGARPPKHLGDPCRLAVIANVNSTRSCQKIKGTKARKWCFRANHNLGAGLADACHPWTAQTKKLQRLVSLALARKHRKMMARAALELALMRAVRAHSSWISMVMFWNKQLGRLDPKAAFNHHRTAKRDKKECASMKAETRKQIHECLSTLCLNKWILAKYGRAWCYPNNAPVKYKPRIHKRGAKTAPSSR